MKAKVLMIAAAVMLFAASSFAQFTVQYFETDQVLTTTCNGGAPIPEGTFFYMYQDVDGNGGGTQGAPDMDDPLAPLCENPPTWPSDPWLPGQMVEGGDCGTGPTGSVNFNRFPFNGLTNLGVEGQFYSDYGFASNGDLPTVNRFYARAFYPSMAHPQIMWTSAVFVPVVGLQEIEASGWFCNTLTVPCTPTASVNLVPTSSFGPQNVSMCASLCPNTPLPVCVGPVVRENRYPTVETTLAGCTCDDNPAGGVVWANSTWTFQVIGGQNYYCNTLMLAPGASEGCVTITLTFLLSAQMGNVSVTPQDGAVEVKFNTLSETDLAGFEVRRNGDVVTTLEATNNASGANYNFVDRNVTNGHVYTYELYVVNADNSKELVSTVEGVVPSMDKAVITEYALGQNYPNPFNPTTNISFDVLHNNPVTLTVYNAQGQLVTTLLNNKAFQTGRHNVSFDATNLPSGLYFYTVKMGNEFTATKKMLLVK